MLTLVAFIGALAVLIVFHEFGHYAAARLCGVKVLRFSVGFGKPLIVKQFEPDGTEWVVAAVPFGGFVKMLGEHDDQVTPADLPKAFNRQSVGKRFFIVAAGPMANFLLAIVIYWGLFIHGMPGQRPVLETPAAGTPAALAGFAKWDTIERIGDTPIQTWEDVSWRLAADIVSGGVVEVLVRDERDRMNVRKLRLDGVSSEDLDRDFLIKMGLLPAKTVQARLGNILENSAAMRAGLRTGDWVIAVDAIPVKSWQEFAEKIREKPGQPITLSVLRNGTSKSVTVIPEPVSVDARTVGRIGVSPDVLVTIQYSVGTALQHAAQKCWDTTVFSLRMLWNMLTGDVSWRHLSGPITIAQVAGETAGIGWLPYLLFIALVSVSLGVINLLPVPILDGGHLMYYMVEFVKGSPVSDMAMEIGQRVGIAALVLLMSVAIYNDLLRQFGP